MDSWILEVFLEAVRQVLREVEVSIDSIGPGGAPGTADGIIANVGFTGDLRGIFTLHVGPSQRGATSPRHDGRPGDRAGQSAG